MCLVPKLPPICQPTPKNTPYHQPTTPSWYNTTWHTGGNAFSRCSRIHNDKKRMNRWFCKSGTCRWYRDNYVLCPQFKRQNWQQLPPPTWGLERIMFVCGKRDRFSFIFALSNRTNCTLGMTKHELPKTNTSLGFWLVYITVAQQNFDHILDEGVII